MREIKCSECGKHLFETDRESDGSIGAEAQHKGFIFKMPFLYTGTAECLFFCSKECFKEYYRKNIPSDPEVNRKLKELKADIPRMAKEVSQKMADLTERLKLSGQRYIGDNPDNYPNKR